MNTQYDAFGKGWFVTVAVVEEKPQKLLKKVALPFGHGTKSKWKRQKREWTVTLAWEQFWVWPHWSSNTMGTIRSSIPSLRQKKYLLFRDKIHRRTYGDVEVDPLHVHFVDDEDEGLVPVRVQVARLDGRLLFLADALLLQKKREIKVSGT